MPQNPGEKEVMLDPQPIAESSIPMNHGQTSFILSSSNFSRNDLERWRMPSLQLAFEVSFAIVSPIEVMADGETYQFNSLNLFLWLIMEIGVFVL